ncbi:MAG: DUF6316 family protein [Pseudomonadota bacterium]
MSRSRFRDQRVFHVDIPGGEAGGWYFEVREGSPRGPYATRRLAELALADYLGGGGPLSHPQDGGDGPDDMDAG